MNTFNVAFYIDYTIKLICHSRYIANYIIKCCGPGFYTPICETLIVIISVLCFVSVTWIIVCQSFPKMIDLECLSPRGIINWEGTSLGARQQTSKTHVVLYVLCCIVTTLADKTQSWQYRRCHCKRSNTVWTTRDTFVFPCERKIMCPSKTHKIPPQG